MRPTARRRTDEAPRRMILRNGLVLTVDGAAPSDAVTAARGDPRVPDACGRRADALAVADGRIVALGPDAEAIAGEADPDTEVVDLAGAVVLPGFDDAHAHPLVEGLTARQPVLQSSPSLRAAMAMLADRGSRLPPDAWLEAWYDESTWPEGRRPTRDELDRAVHDRPVLLHHASGHAMVANSLALGLAGLGAGTPDRAGRVTLGREASGDLEGFVEGSEAYGAFRDAIPPPDPAALGEALALASARLLADGVTSVTDALVGATSGIEPELGAIVDAVGSGTFEPGLDLMLDLAQLAPSPDRDPPSPDDVRAAIPPALRPRVRLATGKLFADGVLSLRTAWLRDPYEDDPTTAGVPALPPDELAERVRRAHAAGWRVAVHAIGDAAIEATLAAFASAMRRHPVPDPGHRIEHAMVISDDQLELARSLGITLVVQPGFVDRADPVHQARLGAARTEWLLPHRRILDRHIGLAFSSDRPFGPGSPLATVRVARDRSGASESDGSPAFISAAEALHAWTAGAAHAARAAGREASAGRLAVGAPADLVVIEGDPFAGSDGAVVRATMLGGRVAGGSLH